MDETCGPPVCIALDWTRVVQLESEPREVLARMKIPTVEASDDRLDALLVFTAVDRRFHQQARGGGATIALIHEQAPHECDVQALQMKMTGQRDGTRKHVGLKDAPDTGSLDVEIGRANVRNPVTNANIVCR